MKKPEFRILDKEIEDLYINKRINLNSALNIIIDKYDFKDIFELKEMMYSTEINLLHATTKNKGFLLGHSE